MDVQPNINLGTAWVTYLVPLQILASSYRSYFETSHAKGEQDAVGSHIKQKVSQAVLRRTATISKA